MLESAVLTCIGLLCFQLHFICGATLFLSFEVRRPMCCDSAVDFTGKKVVSVVAIFKKSKSPVLFTCPGKESALPGVFVDFSFRLLEGSSLRRVTVADGCLRMNCIAARNQTFASYLSLKLSVLPLHADFPWNVLVVSNHALLKSFLQRKKQSLPNVRLHVLVGASTDRWIRKCWPQMARCHTTKPADRCARRQFSVDSHR